MYQTSCVYGCWILAMSLYNFFVRGVQLAKNIFIPSFCVYCKEWLEEQTILCIPCRLLIQPVVSVTVEVTSPIAMKVFAASKYQDPLKSIILAKGKFDCLASKFMGQLVWEFTAVRSVDFDYIVPIPLHWRRYAYRGYNQAAMMAHELTKKSGKQTVELIRRKQYTVFQSVLSLKERKDNVKDVFMLQQGDLSAYYGKHFLLADDLMTSGATLKAAAKCLLPLKPASITAVVLCRT